MPIAVSVLVDFKPTKRYIDNLNDRNIPFAAAVTLTRLAQGSHLRIRAEMDRFFTLRSKNRMLKGVRFKPAKKGDFKRGIMHSEVNDIDPFMAVHTTGGTKRATRHRFISIPDDFLLAQGARTTTGAIKKRLRPKTMINRIKASRKGRPRKKGRHRKPKPFVMEDSNAHPLIAVRRGRKKKPLNFLWGMATHAKIDRTWPFAETVRLYCISNTTKIFKREFEQARRAARTI